MADQMLPITRDLLKKYYSKYPPAAPSAELEASNEQAVAGIARLRAALAPIAEAAALVESVAKMETEPPHKMDTNIYENRCQLEEIADLWKPKNIASLEERLKGVEGFDVTAFKQAVADSAAAATAVAASWEEHQKECVQQVESLVRTYLPQDLRMSIVNTFRQRSEAKAAREIQELVERGESIRAKYDLMWQQQLHRRESLVMLGNASGVFKAVIRYIGGVPQVFLDFIKTVNNDNGPMEEYRVTYGPYQYWLTRYITRVRMMNALLYVAASHLPNASAEARVELSKAMAELPAQSVDMLAKYTAAIKAWIALLFTILQHSPFFVSKKDMEASIAESGQKHNVVVSKTHDVAVQLFEGDKLEWEFTTDKDIQFKATFEAEAAKGKLVAVHELLLVNSHVAPVTGSYTAKEQGMLTLVWDNTHSWFTSKNLTFRVLRTPNPEKLSQAVEESVEQLEAAAAAASASSSSAAPAAPQQ
eukprot:m51a1_g618 hypothetical protein (476) ;mRNA; f:106485-108745